MFFCVVCVSGDLNNTKKHKIHISFSMSNLHIKSNALCMSYKTIYVCIFLDQNVVDTHINKAYLFNKIHDFLELCVPGTAWPMLARV